MNCEAVAEYIVEWLGGYARKAGVGGFVIGVSGGIDSAVCSILAAMTGMPALCVTMPIHQPVSHVSRAEEHIAALKGRHPNVSSENVSLTVPYEALIAAFPQTEDHRCQLANANTRSRLRMTALYHLAALHGRLVVGTGNKIEDFGIGFFTKYGDGGVDVSPIADLTKTEVYELGAYLRVPESILSALPADGLFGDDRSDEQQIGASYPELEWAMEQSGKGAQAEQFTGRQREVFDIYTRRNRANRHKMQMPPFPSIPEEFKSRQ